MSTDYTEFQVAQNQYPLPSTANTKLYADPTIRVLLDFSSAMIEQYLGTFWTSLKANSNTGLTTEPVIGSKVTYDPFAFWQSANYKFPLLAVFRNGSTKSQKTTIWYIWDSKVELNFVLPPLSASQYNNMRDYLRAVRDVVADRLNTRWDPSYQDGYTVIDDANIGALEVVSETVEYLPNPQNDLTFPVLRLEIEMQEKEKSAPNLSVFETLATTIAIQDPEETDPTDAFTVEVEQDLT